MKQVICYLIMLSLSCLIMACQPPAPGHSFAGLAQGMPVAEANAIAALFIEMIDAADDGQQQTNRETVSAVWHGQL